MGPEVKYVDTAVNLSVVPTSTSAGFTLLNGLFEGNGASNRVGKRIHMKSLVFRFICLPTNNLPAATTMQPNPMRVAIIYDRQPNGSLPTTIQDVFQDRCPTTGTTDTLSNDIFSCMNMENRDRFVILRDWKFVSPSIFNSSGTTAGYPTSLVLWNNKDMCGQYNEAYIKLKNLETHFKTNSNGIADISTGSLLAMFWGGAATNYWTVNYSSRLKYIDV